KPTELINERERYVIGAHYAGSRQGNDAQNAKAPKKSTDNLVDYCTIDTISSNEGKIAYWNNSY
ncbi:hypothetical protein, partial [Clostridium perfringens]